LLWYDEQKIALVVAIHATFRHLRVSHGAANRVDADWKGRLESLVSVFVDCPTDANPLLLIFHVKRMVLLPPALPRLIPSSDVKVARALRMVCRNGHHKGPTANHAPGFIQANLVAVPRIHAFDFLMFTLKNPKPCPLLDVVDNRNAESSLAVGSDLRRDLPRYRVWKNGKIVEELDDVTKVWPIDAVSFLLGCSFTFEAELKSLSLLSKTNDTVAMYRTKVKNVRSGVFGGNLVVSMRMIHPEHIDSVVKVTSKHQLSHGAPVALGFDGMKELGINDLSRPDFGESSSTDPNCVPVFWACGVTPQTAIEDAGSGLHGTILTHAPGCMFVTDIPY